MLIKRTEMLHSALSLLAFVPRASAQERVPLRPGIWLKRSKCKREPDSKICSLISAKSKSKKRISGALAEIKQDENSVRNPKQGRVFYPWISNFANVTIGQSTCAT